MSRATAAPYLPSASLPFGFVSRRRLTAGYLRSTSTKLFSPGRLVLLSTMSNDATTAPPLAQEAAVETVGRPSSFASNRSTSTQSGDAVGSVKQQLSKIFKASLQATFPNEQDVEPLVSVSTAKFGDYQCNNAMGMWSKIKGKSTEFSNPNSIGQALVRNLPASEIIESTSVAKAGFINIILSNAWIAKHIERMLLNGIETWAPIIPVKRAVVDFSSPNIAKEMHVGHLRSTIIGDTLARMLEFSNVEVLRRNHVGDWGTQFGMLIEYLFEMSPNGEDAGQQAIGDLQDFYKASKKKFDEDASFKEKAQKAVVRLQGGELKYRNAWKEICEISRREFAQVYQRLGVHLEEKDYCKIHVAPYDLLLESVKNENKHPIFADWYTRDNSGESFYNPYIPDTIRELDDKGLVVESEGARVIFIEGQQIPLIVVKSDGGYNYASTDLTAIRYRLREEKAEWIIYVTDVGQQNHFDMVFSAARRASWLPESVGSSFPKASHVGFGLVLGADGKRFRTRSSEVVRLVDLLDEAKNRCRKELEQRLENHGKLGEWTGQELEKTAEAVGYGAVKYADLKNNRLTNYTFSFDQMLNDKGNTAVYLLYAHARICSIIRKSNRDLEELKKVVEEACLNLLPNVLCEYLYNLSETFTRFYTSCQVIGSAEESSRLLLCEATAVVMRQCFELLGIEPVYKI